MPSFIYALCNTSAWQLQPARVLYIFFEPSTHHFSVFTIGPVQLFTAYELANCWNDSLSIWRGRWKRGSGKRDTRMHGWNTRDAIFI